MSVIDTQMPAGGLSDASGVNSHFRVETADVVNRLRSALHALVAEVAGKPLGKSRDAQKHFNVDVKLSWQLFRTLNGGDPLEAVEHIPPHVSMAKLLREVRRKRIADRLVDDVERSYAEFERHVDRHAGDRQSFTRMIGGAAPSLEEELSQRESVYEAMRHVYGVQADATLQVTMLHPTPDNRRDKFSMVSLASLRDFCRWSTSAPTLLFKHRFGAEENQSGRGGPVPLDPAAFERVGVPLMDRFSTTPSPAVRLRQAAEGLCVTELSTDAVGRLSSIDITQGQFFPAVSLYPIEGRMGWRMARINARPVRSSTFDLIVHRPTFGLLQWKASRHGNITTFPKTLEDLQKAVDVSALPSVDPVTFLGSAASVGPATGVNCYRELIQSVCDQRGWNIEEMDVYRQFSAFPLPATMDAVDYTIPGSETWPKPDGGPAV